MGHEWLFFKHCDGYITRFAGFAAQKKEPGFAGFRF
jgi:hypothetical protein